MNETLRAVDGRHELRMERRFAHSRDRVWRAITDPDHLRAWFPASVRITVLERGAEMEFTFEGQEESSIGEIVEVDPPRVFAFTWNGEVLRFDLAPVDDGALMVFTQVFDDRPGAASFATGWTVCLDYLEAMLAGDDDPVARWVPALHEGFVERFGLDQGHLETAPGGWDVRFERQLTQPVDVVWSLLAGSAATVVGGPVPAGCCVEAFPADAVVALDDGRMLAYDWSIDGRTAGTIRWELQPGPGGARVMLHQHGPEAPAGLSESALSVWRVRIEELAGELSRMPRSTPN